ncbi:hypothetical protein CEK28_03820 [Xenophilus sp. AP218F]|nr:hypothetical protein CEK28_03820 [Xenophilus sp. AP218F]
MLASLPASEFNQFSVRVNGEVWSRGTILQNLLCARRNDTLRRHFIGGHVVMTEGFRALPNRDEFLQRITAFEAFEPGDDPYLDRSFGCVEIGGQKAFWKIDYYDKDCHYASEEPWNPEKTTRVLTLMLAEEY